MNDINKIYFDLEHNIFVSEEKRNSDLENRNYILYEKGTSPDVITEHYYVSGNKRLDYSYSNSLQRMMTKETCDSLRSEFILKNTSDGWSWLFAITVPEDLFNSYLEGI